MDVIDVISASNSTSVLFGKGKHLATDPESFMIDMRSANRTDKEFTITRFIDLAVWLNNTIGFENWYFDDMKYYFKSKNDLIMFKIVVFE